MPAMESVHERTGSDAVPEEEAVVRGAILESLKERKMSWDTGLFMKYGNWEWIGVTQGNVP